MDGGPFNRRSWVTQSLRVTAKELSLSGRGRHNAIAERFSKYQKAAEESSAEKKKASDVVAPSLRSANLSALKKRWEQPSVPPPAQHVPRSRPPAASRPAPLLQGGQLATRHDQQPPAAGKAPQGDGGMDSDELTQREGPETPEEQVPNSPRGSYEKPRVPLNNLKMRFEKGEDARNKVIKDLLAEEDVSK